MDTPIATNQDFSDYMVTKGRCPECDGYLKIIYTKNELTNEPEPDRKRCEYCKIDYPLI